MPSDNIIYQSILKCPYCGYEKEEEMPANACLHFYECANCAGLLKPKPGGCCVHCSFGTVKCPPKQKEEDQK